MSGEFSINLQSAICNRYVLQFGRLKDGGGDFDVFLSQPFAQSTNNGRGSRAVAMNANGVGLQLDGGAAGGYHFSLLDQAHYLGSGLGRVGDKAPGKAATNQRTIGVIGPVGKGFA